MARDWQQGGTVGDMLLTAIARHGDRVALVDGQRAFTYRQLGAAIRQAIATLRAAGLQRGDTVAQLSGNRCEMFAVMAAAYVAGFRSVTLNPSSGLSDHRHILQDCSPQAVIAESAQEGRVAQLRAEGERGPRWFSHDRAAAGLAPFWLASEVSEGMPSVQALPEDVVRLAYTGGTTGRPKGVMLSSRALMMQAMMILAARDLPVQPVFLCSTPISHGAGALLVPVLWKGGTVVLHRKFEVGAFLDAIAQQGVNVVYLVPTMLYRLLDDPRTAGAELSSLKTLAYGAAPIAPARIRQALERFGPILTQSYGQTESPSNILQLNQDDHASGDARILASSGLPYPGVTVRLLDDAGQAVVHGGVGEICVRGPLLMDGYWNDAAQTAAALQGGWLHTGDLAYQDPQGYFHICGRKKDMIISGGYNIYPKEIEDVLSEHPAVEMAAVIGVPDADWGESVKAIVQLRAHARATPDELIAFVKERKGRVQSPKTVALVDRLPLTALGKPDKQALREQHAPPVPTPAR